MVDHMYFKKHQKLQSSSHLAKPTPQILSFLFLFLVHVTIQLTNHHTVDCPVMCVDPMDAELMGQPHILTERQLGLL